MAEEQNPQLRKIIKLAIIDISLFDSDAIEQRVEQIKKLVNFEQTLAFATIESAPTQTTTLCNITTKEKITSQLLSGRRSSPDLQMKEGTAYLQNLFNVAKLKKPSVKTAYPITLTWPTYQERDNFRDDMETRLIAIKKLLNIHQLGLDEIIFLTTKERHAILIKNEYLAIPHPFYKGLEIQPANKQLLIDSLSAQLEPLTVLIDTTILTQANKDTISKLKTVAAGNHVRFILLHNNQEKQIKYLSNLGTEFEKSSFVYAPSANSATDKVSLANTLANISSLTKQTTHAYNHIIFILSPKMKATNDSSYILSFRNAKSLLPTIDSAIYNWANNDAIKLKMVKIEPVTPRKRFVRASSTQNFFTTSIKPPLIKQHSTLIHSPSLISTLEQKETQNKTKTRHNSMHSSAQKKQPENQPETQPAPELNLFSPRSRGQSLSSKSKITIITKPASLPLLDIAIAQRTAADTPLSSASCSTDTPGSEESNIPSPITNQLSTL